MNRPANHPRGSGANPLPAILLGTLLASLALLGVLQLLPKSVYPPASAGAWSECLPHVETAIEEALSRRPFNSSNLVACGWTRIGPDRYLKTNALAGGGYAVTMSAHQPYEIMATGYVHLAGTTKTVRRAVMVSAFDAPAIPFAVLVRDRSEVKGNDVRIDRFDSRDPVNSPMGLYVAANAREQAGIEPGWSRIHAQTTFPDVVPPFSAAMRPGEIGRQFDGVTYDQVFDHGSYMMSSLTGRTLVTGLAVVYVTGDIDAELITLRPGAHLLLYGGGASTRFTSVDNQSKLAGHLIYLGLPANTSLSLNSDWIGIVYAPNCHLNAGEGIEICGRICVKSLTANGGMRLHFDEALGASTNTVHPVIASWREL